MSKGTPTGCLFLFPDIAASLPGCPPSLLGRLAGVPDPRCFCSWWRSLADYPSQPSSQPGKRNQVATHNTIDLIKYSCEGKHAYPAKGTARQVLRRSRNRKRAVGVYVYHCQHCHQWHLGMSIRKPRRRRA